MSSNYIIYAETNQSTYIKNLIGFLKNQRPDTNLIFTSNGIEILDRDPTNTFMINIQLFANEFNKFICKRDLIIGCNLKILDKIINKVNTNDTLIFFVEETEDLSDDTTYPFGVIICKPNKQKSKLYINTMDTDNIQIPLKDDISVPSYEIIMSTSDFIDVIAQIKVIEGDIVRIMYNKGALTFYTKGMYVSGSVDKDNNSPNLVINKKDMNLSDNEIICIYVSTSRLIDFSKGNLLSQKSNMSIYLGNELTIEYKVGINGTLGTVKLLTGLSCKPENW